ncbi:MAG TPA: hypothetical protein VJM31_19895 [Vicinamibacterales bacterium]|nr:hypothetical protein [Vicinamibacterales bacterium]
MRQAIFRLLCACGVAPESLTGTSARLAHECAAAGLRVIADEAGVDILRYTAAVSTGS